MKAILLMAISADALFKGADVNLDLELLEVKQLDTHVIQVRYKVIKCHSEAEPKNLDPSLLPAGRQVVQDDTVFYVHND